MLKGLTTSADRRRSNTFWDGKRNESKVILTKKQKQLQYEMGRSRVIAKYEELKKIKS